MRVLISFVFLLIPFFSKASFLDEFEKIPIQYEGRVQPFRSFSQNALRFIYGSETFKKQKASLIVFSFYLSPQSWTDLSLIKISDLTLKKYLKLKEEKTHFSLKNLSSNQKLKEVFNELSSLKEEDKESEFFKKVSLLDQKISLFLWIQSGDLLRFFPEKNKKEWNSFKEASKKQKEAFLKLSSSFTHYISGKKINPLVFKEFYESLSHEKKDLFSVQIESLMSDLKPFKYSWILYFLALIFLSFFIYLKRKSLFHLSLFLGFSAFFLHLLGLFLRFLVLKRPPVTNMFESVVWVSLCVFIFSWILYYFYRKNSLIFSSFLGGFLGLFLCDISPEILDPSLRPLEPVLRDHFWLIFHVMLICVSYACFFTAFVISHIQSFYYLKVKRVLKIFSTLSYRCVQVGVVFLALGTILGGIWADYSWGRFWGWDPKETWALISLISYLSLLHARLISWISDLFWAISCIFCFTLVLFAWYGVNFVLGAGLHSYGFGTGGSTYVFSYLILEWLFLIFVGYKYKSLKK